MSYVYENDTMTKTPAISGYVDFFNKKFIE